MKEYLPDSPLHAVFCDSTADLKRVVASMETGELQANIAGVRLRTPNIPSRFGIPVDTPEVFETLIESIQMLPRETAFGVHFHMASSNVGVQQWWHLFESMLKWCSSIEALAGRRIECLDMGGGWFPDDWHEGSNSRLVKAVSSVSEYLPHVKEIVSEPGKAMAQPSMALAMRILEIQDAANEEVEVVVDGSIAELPMYFFYPHRILHQDSITGNWKTLGRGKAHLLGRLCMEHDIVASNIELPEEAKAGDLLVFCDAGAYDRSMSYVFGRG
jgi:diaminopimelate decarboxylase